MIGDFVRPGKTVQLFYSSLGSSTPPVNFIWSLCGHEHFWQYLDANRLLLCFSVHNTPLGISKPNLLYSRNYNFSPPPHGSYTRTLQAFLVRAHIRYECRCNLRLRRRNISLVDLAPHRVMQEDFMKAVRKIAENKKLEGKVDYAKV